jgi:hypothetical protein
MESRFKTSYVRASSNRSCSCMLLVSLVIHTLFTIIVRAFYCDTVARARILRTAIVYLSHTTQLRTSTMS